MFKRLIAGLALAGAPLLVISAQSPAAGEVVLRAAAAPLRTGGWSVQADSSASAGAAVALPDAGVPKLATAAASPRDYFEATFQVRAGTPYRLWMRGRAQNDAWTNDSVFIQFSGSVSSAGQPVFRIGSTDATVVSVEECSGCGLSGWGWSDNGYGRDGDPIYFAADGVQTIRVQAREDGITIDEIVLSPAAFLASSPGAAKQDTTTLAPSSGAAASPVTRVRGPYLQQPAPDAMTVVWATREPGAAEVRYQSAAGSGSAPATSRLVPSSTTSLGYDYYQHEARLTGLAPATAHTYQALINGTSVGSAAEFRTLPGAAGSIRFVAFGDSGTGSAEQRQLASLMAGETADLALHAGDIVYGSSSTTGDATYATYQAWFFDIYSWLTRIPIVPTEGNHDSRASNGDGRAYLDLFSLPDNAPQRERYYSFDGGPVHFLVLDTEFAFQDTTRRAEQVAWAESDLASTRQPWKVVLYHRSPYSSGAEHGSDLAVRAAFAPMFERYGVDVSLSGHDHDYERSKPVKESTSATDRPVTYVVTGGGGAALYPTASSWWTAYSASRFHYVRGEADTCTLKFEAIGLDGVAFDNATLSRCSTSTQPQDVVLYASHGVRGGAWVAQSDASAAAGSYVIHPDAGAPKLLAAAAAPINYVDLSFDAAAGVPYRLWLRGRAESDYYGNDSVFVQFSDAIDSNGGAAWRIGTTDATIVVLEDCGGCGEQGWGWQDNGYGTGVLGPVVTFATAGPHRLRIQTREDGLGIDQVVLSPARYLSTAPGALKNDGTILTPSGGR